MATRAAHHFATLFDGRSMFPGGLRAKLFVSFAAIIVLCLGLAGSAFVYLLQPYQTQQALNRLSELVVPLGAQVRFMGGQGATGADITSFLDDQANALGIRILLIQQSNQDVLHDTGGTLAGTTLVFQGREAPPRDSVIQATADVPNEGQYVIVEFSRVSAAERANPLAPLRLPPDDDGAYTVALAAPQASLATGWSQIAPPLRTAGLISIIASFLAALFVARSILRPITQVTRASEAMARGDYNQQIEAKGSGEIAQLAASFNLMARQVARSNQTLRDFLADVSHELRTPLTTIEGFSEAILDGTAHDDAAVHESARIILEDAHRMHRMVEDLLYLSKVESGQLSMDVETIDLMEVLRRVVLRARNLADGQTIELRPTVHPFMVAADQHRIGQVLDNLLVNAVQHTPAGGVITVSAEAHDGQARVRVHNTGSYISPEHLESIFQRFYRGSNDGKGAGLGLAIASEIARAHGGQILVESGPVVADAVEWMSVDGVHVPPAPIVPVTGTAFTLVLPLSTQHVGVGLKAAA